jgi:hypothetical protein
LKEYFNYSPEIDLKYLGEYPNIEDFKTLLRADLDAHLPICYSGSGPSNGSGHVFVCDGYRMSDGKFHFNWGWSGYADGYYAIGSLNPGGSNLNLGNSVILHIKPYNSSLIVRITNPVDRTMTGVNDIINIRAKVVSGLPNRMSILIDNQEMSATSGDSISFSWHTTEPTSDRILLRLLL